MASFVSCFCILLYLGLPASFGSAVLAVIVSCLLLFQVDAVVLVPVSAPLRLPCLLRAVLAAALGRFVQLGCLSHFPAGGPPRADWCRNRVPPRYDLRRIKSPGLGTQVRLYRVVCRVHPTWPDGECISGLFYVIEIVDWSTYRIGRIFRSSPVLCNF